MALSLERKQELYKAGKYLFKAPPVSHHLWTDSDWITYIDNHHGWQLIPDSDRWNDPMVNLHFWQWLTENKDHVDIEYRIRMIPHYMETLGLEPGVDYLNSRDLSLLQGVYDHWWYMTKKPLLEARLKGAA